MIERMGMLMKDSNKSELEKKKDEGTMMMIRYWIQERIPSPVCLYLQYLMDDD